MHHISTHLIVRLDYRWPFGPPGPALAQARPGLLLARLRLARPNIKSGHAVLAHGLSQRPRHRPTGLFHAVPARRSPALKHRPDRPKAHQHRPLRFPPAALAGASRSRWRGAGRTAAGGVEQTEWWKAVRGTASRGRRQGTGRRLAPGKGGRWPAARGWGRTRRRRPSGGRRRGGIARPAGDEEAAFNRRAWRRGGRVRPTGRTRGRGGSEAER